MRIPALFMLGGLACSATGASEFPATSESPLECAVHSVDTDSSDQTVRSAGWSQGHNHVMDLLLTPDSEETCCTNYYKAVSSSAPADSVWLVFHQNGPGEYGIVPGHQPCSSSSDAGVVDCSGDRQARATYKAANGQTYEGFGTLHIASGGVFDARSVTGTIDVWFDLDGSHRQLKVVFAGQRCGTE